MISTPVIFIFAAHAKYNIQSGILSNKNVIHCSSQFGDNSDECIEDISDKSNLALNKIYQDKLKQIESANYSSWWMGSKEQRYDMIQNFKLSQKNWREYKINYCKSASAASQNSHSYGEELTSCFINMNQRRIEEINMMGETQPSLPDP
ncbi:lysozyme inhibitor LprI family protein [Pantoea sp. B65]|uniref:lysozyme inhibitor LprI family protein n=1 Tax=Pantoea sp. B65 TaxID=2813359 RepID=UPI0039B3AE83